jgi:antirestriction protein ArdC
MAKKIDEIITEKILDKMKEGIIPWHKPWTYGRAVSRAGRLYTGINAWLLPSGEYITFNQIKKEGGTLTKGSESEIVIMHIINEEVADDGSTRTKYGGKRYYRVYNILDTDLEPKHQEIYEGVTEEYVLEDKHKLFDQYIEDFCGFEGISLHIINSSRAYYSPSADKIVVPEKKQYKEISEYYSTKAHETIHSTGNQDRLKRYENAVFGDHEYSKEELVAELGACMLVTEHNIATEQSFNNTTAYLQSWMKKLEENPNWIFWAAGKAKKAIDFIAEKVSHVEKARELNES